MEEKIVLVVNVGSSSKRYTLFKDSVIIWQAHLTKDKDSFYVLYPGRDYSLAQRSVCNSINECASFSIVGQWANTKTLSKFTNKIRDSIQSEKQNSIDASIKEKITQEQYDNCAQLLLNNIKETTSLDINKVNCIAFRCAAPGSYFQSNRVIDANFKEKLKSIAEFSLHAADLLHELEVWDLLLGNVIGQSVHKASQSISLGNIRFVAISDSAFHATMNMSARQYALPEKVVADLDIYRFGYHGISISSVLNTLKKILNLNILPKNIIVCHLGGGSSVTAIKDGTSYDTSMGFSPLDGLPMATRSGAIDSAAVLYLMKEKNFSIHQAFGYLARSCGLLNINNKASNMQELISLAEFGNGNAKQAIDLFVYSIVKFIGSYIAILGGVDALVFTGGIGENSSYIRSLVCSRLTAFNIKIDAEKNKTIINDSDVSSQLSSTKIFVIKTQEAQEINSQALSL